MELAFVVLVAVLVRVIVGLWGHSGYGSHPMHGDFEAQRHWLEITTALPIGEWYQQTPLNDLQYWGLDYPPLTAYVSYGFGKIAELVIPRLVELQSSRGYEQIDGRVFMRLTVILCDLMIYIPIAIEVANTVYSWLCMKTKSNFPKHSLAYLLTVLTFPGLILIDHGHFQYNGVCLALALYGLLLVSRDKDMLGSFFFCMALNFKQMALYYAPVFFCFLLRKCLIQKSWTDKFASFLKLGVTVVVSFSVLWAPFCLYHHPEDTCTSALLQVLHRQFPFSRGIFEDKVANIWYTLSVLVDFRAFLSPSQLLPASLGLTLLLLSPTMYLLLTRPASLPTLLLAMINSSLAFFLASFQVHEKSILLALAPASLLLLLDPTFFSWLQVLGCFTMFPLLVKDKLRIPYVACVSGYLALVSLTGITEALMIRNHTDNGRNNHSSTLQSVFKWDSCRCWGSYLCLMSSTVVDRPVVNILLGLSYIGMVVLHGMELRIPAPTRLPDLYAALFSIFGAANLLYAYLVCIQKMYITTISADSRNSSSSSSSKSTNNSHNSNTTEAVHTHRKTE